MRKSVAVAVAVACGCLAFAEVAPAAIVYSTPSTVLSQSTYTFTYYGSGDVTFQLSSNSLTQCYGFWLRPTDAGFKNNFAVLLAQIEAGGSISLMVDDAQIWAGSGHPYCLVYSLVF